MSPDTETSRQVSARAGRHWRTAISEATEDRVRIRGYDLGELVANVDFGSVVHLLLAGELPDARRARVVNAVLTSMADHAISPSSVVSRYLSSAGVPLQVSVAGALLGIGDTYGGACEQFAELLQTEVAAADGKLREQAAVVVDGFLDQRLPVPGYGHPLHPDGDPRVPPLTAAAEANGVAGPHMQFASMLGDALEERKGRRFPFNNDGCVAAVVSDLGFSWKATRAFIVIARSVGLAAHSLEESEREPGWRHVPLSDASYDGPGPRDLPTP